MSSGLAATDWREVFALAKANVKPTPTRNALSAMSTGKGRPSDPSNYSSAPYLDDFNRYANIDGTMRVDHANKGWSNAWARKYSTRASKSARRSNVVGWPEVR